MINCRMFPLVALLLGIGLAASPAPAVADDAPDLAGTWTWRWKDAEGNSHTHTLVIEGRAPDYGAQERLDDQEPVKVTDLKVVGKRVTFSVLRDDRRAAYSGEIASKDTINGEVQVTGPDNRENKYGWTAQRESRPED